MGALIDKQIPDLMARIGVIGKNGKNSQQNYKFRSIEDVMNAINPALIELRLGSSIRCEDVQYSQTTEKKPNGGDRILFRTSCRVIITLTAEDGSAREFSAIGVGLDYGGDKDANKAMSAGMKYALGHGLCIPFKGMDDSDADASPGQEATATTEPEKVDVLAAARAAEAATQQAGGAVGQPNPYSVDVNGPCSQSQVDRVIQLAKDLAMPKEALKAAVAKRGKSKLAELTDKQIRELIANLERKCGEKNIPF